MEWYEPIEGRASVVARIAGSDPDAPSLALVGHTDVVPADEADGWRHDPFGGEIVGGEVWGRGAVDMLNQTAAMAVAFRRLAGEGFRPKGDLVFWGVPDEECGGGQGASLTLTENADLVRTDFALTEVGGTMRRGVDGWVVDAAVADKGGLVLEITVRGRQGHSSLPYAADNPVIKAAEVMRRLVEWQPTIRVAEPWRRWVGNQGFAPDVAAALVDPNRINDVLEVLPPDTAAHAHACTRCVVVPTIIQGGDAGNTIPQTVRIGVFARPTLGDDHEAIGEELRALIADLVDPADVFTFGADAIQSPIDTPLWDVLSDVTATVHRDATLTPAMLAAWTDAQWLRRAGTTTYGFGLLSENLTAGEYWSRFHGVDERIDIESLSLSTLGWYEVSRRFLS